MQLSKPQMVIFDVDGTVMVKKRGYMTALQILAGQDIAEKDIPPQARDAYRQNAFPDDDDYAGQALLESMKVSTARWDEKFEEIRMRPDKGYEILEGAKEAVDGLREQNVTIAFASLSEEAKVRPVLEHFGLLKEADIFCSSASGNKESAVASLLEERGISPENVWIIGDSTGDMTVGVALKLGAVIATKQASDNGAQFIMQDQDPETGTHELDARCAVVQDLSALRALHMRAITKTR